MKIPLLYGLSLALISIIAGLVARSLDLTFIISGVSGLAALFLAGILTGAFVSGDRVRANYHSEHKQSREKRYQLMVGSLWFSIPNLLTAIVSVLIFISTN